MKLLLDRLFPTYAALARPLVFGRFHRLAPLPNHAHILCIGIHTAASLNWLVRYYHPASLTVIASSPRQSASLRKAAASAPIIFVETRPDTIPLPAHTYDTILCFTTLARLPEWRRTVSEFTRLLRHGGALYLYEAYNSNLTRKALKADLAHHGFLPLGIWPNPTNTLKRWLADRITLSASRLAIAQQEYD